MVIEKSSEKQDALLSVVNDASFSSEDMKSSVVSSLRSLLQKSNGEITLPKQIDAEKTELKFLAEIEKVEQLRKMIVSLWGQREEVSETIKKIDDHSESLYEKLQGLYSEQNLYERELARKVRFENFIKNQEIFYQHENGNGEESLIRLRKDPVYSATDDVLIRERMEKKILTFDEYMKELIRLDVKIPEFDLNSLCAQMSGYSSNGDNITLQETQSVIVAKDVDGEGRDCPCLDEEKEKRDKESLFEERLVPFYECLEELGLTPKRTVKFNPITYNTSNQPYHIVSFFHNDKENFAIVCNQYGNAIYLFIDENFVENRTKKEHREAGAYRIIFPKRQSCRATNVADLEKQKFINETKDYIKNYLRRILKLENK